jgi:hypothetical protein
VDELGIVEEARVAMKTTSKNVKDIFVDLIRNVPPQEWDARLEQATVALP